MSSLWEGKKPLSGLGACSSPWIRCPGWQCRLLRLFCNFSFLRFPIFLGCARGRGEFVRVLNLSYKPASLPSLCPLQAADRCCAQIFFSSLQTHCCSYPHCYLPWKVDLFGPHQRAALLSESRKQLSNWGQRVRSLDGRPEEVRTFIPLAPSLWDPSPLVLEMESQSSSQGGPLLRPLSECC